MFQSEISIKLLLRIIQYLPMKKIILLLIVGLTVSIATYGANVTFNKVYPGTGTSYTLNSSSISWTTPISGSSYKFTSANPVVVTFSGN